MKTPQMWLEEVLSDEPKLHHWLQRQYVGEMLAAERIYQLAQHADLDTKSAKVISRIASDESAHAQWVLFLLVDRDIPIPKIEYKDDRYWKAVLPQTTTLDQTLAAGHHAEEMRLVRIRLLAQDSRVPQDIRDTFSSILRDEEFHVKAFGQLASEDAIIEMAQHHEAGMQLLGLEI